jgi:CDP-glycerol glycerophosphotransferase (TagB/SpsB family)
MVGADMRGFHVMPVEAERQAVWGIASKEWAIKRGKAPETQVITGNPRYDSILTTKSTSREARITVCRKLGLDTRTGIVVIATSWYQPISSCYTPEDVEAFVVYALTAMKSFPEKSVVVKLHPNFSKEYEATTRSIIEQLQVSKAVVTERFLWELLSMCELLITDTSTVGLEAILLDKPVIVFNPAPDPNLNPYIGTDFVINVNKADDLVPAIRDALYDGEVRRKLAEARRRSVCQYAYCQDGKASRRVGHLIEQMV